MNTHPISIREFHVSWLDRPIFSTIRLVVFILDQGAELNPGECTTQESALLFLSEGLSFEGFLLKCVLIYLFIVQATHKMDCVILFYLYSQPGSEFDPGESPRTYRV